ncbi:MAG: metal-binding protein [Mogibacterium sp.]|nr:metal-binding protein [Mogibacterium sp.]
MKNSYKFFENRECKYYPCHKGIDEINCLFCYCPLYHLEKCPGAPSYVAKDGKMIKVCTACTFPHQPDNYDKVIETIKANR